MADTAAVEHEPQAQLKQPVAPAAPAQIVRPDGGYGWIVVMASFVAHFVCLGEMYKQQQQSWLCQWPSISPHALPPSLPPLAATPLAFSLLLCLMMTALMAIDPLRHGLAPWSLALCCLPVRAPARDLL